MTDDDISSRGHHTPNGDGKQQYNVFDEAISFLEQLRPGGPWVLTAILPDKPDDQNIPRTITQTIHSATEVETFLTKHNSIRNLYYSVNPTRGSMSKKAAKVDIAAIEYLPADLDPK